MVMISSIHANLTKPGFTAYAEQRVAASSPGDTAVAHPLPTSRYATSKGGLKTLTNALAVELGPLGIRVNAVRSPAAPGSSAH